MTSSTCSRDHGYRPRNAARVIESLRDQIALGIGDPVALGARTKELAIERSEIEHAMEAMRKTTEAIMLHPTVLSHYESQVAALQTAMTRELRRGDSEPARILRELIETVTAEPSAPTGLRIEIAGRLRALLGERAFPNGSVVCGTLVAEDGFEPPTHGL
jgi:site-specific DNA recombinase